MNKSFIESFEAEMRLKGYPPAAMVFPKIMAYMAQAIWDNLMREADSQQAYTSEEVKELITRGVNAGIKESASYADHLLAMGVGKGFRH